MYLRIIKFLPEFDQRHLNIKQLFDGERESLLKKAIIRRQKAGMAAAISPAFSRLKIPENGDKSREKTFDSI